MGTTLRHVLLAATAIVIAALNSGCATIVEGTDQMVSFESEPSGATVKVNGKAIGQTPVSARLEKGNNKTLTFEQEGHETVTRDLSTSIEPWFFGNVVTGGFFGSTTDFASGAIYEYSPNQYFVTLPPSGGGGMATEKQQVEKFVVANFAQLQSASAKPEPMDSMVFKGLVNQIGIYEKNQEAIGDLAAMLLNADDAARAADAVTSEFKL